MTQADIDLAKAIGRQTVQHLLEWDLYESPRHAFVFAQTEWEYDLKEEEYLHFKEGVLEGFTEHKNREAMA